MKKYNKLVRDKIPQIIQSSGKTPFIDVYSDKEFKKALNNKLEEELSEYLKSESLDELVDLEEVIQAIIKSNSISKKEFTSLLVKKAKERGKFNNKIKLIKVG